MRTAYNSREDAVKLGHETYLGRKCPRCDGRERKTVNSACISCEKETNYSKNREEKLRYAKEYYHKTKDTRRIYRLLQEAKRRAKAQGLPFELVESDIVLPKLCPVFGTPLTQPSLDRKNNELGYVKGNVFVISLEANQKKRDSTIEDLEALLRYMKS